MFRTIGSCGATDAEVLNFIHFGMLLLIDVLLVSHDIKRMPEMYWNISVFQSTALSQLEVGNCCTLIFSIYLLITI